jgi:antitoxin ParD1/3/4
MNDIDLGDHFDGFVREQVQKGRFQDASDVVRAALGLLEERERERAAHRAELVRQLDEARDDPRPDLTLDQAFERLERRHAARLAEGTRAS